jgi:ATP-binding cassette subfamily B protein
MNETDPRSQHARHRQPAQLQTVKYFGNEEYEAQRFDQALARYERASVARKSSLSLLNVGQASHHRRRARRAHDDGARGVVGA